MKTKLERWGKSLADITSDNVHTEIDFGDPLGNEIW